jgi:tetratricopeptide (TPR) repeat protein
MPDETIRPVIFISYSHKDEPDQFLQPGEVQWLSYVKSFLEPAAAHGCLELWDDRQIDGGGNWKADINGALERCAVCVLLVSRHSLSSRFILDVEMKRMLERHHANGAHLYPIVITSTDLGAAPWLLKLNLKPTNGTALELYENGPRNKIMSDLAAEVRGIVQRAASASATDANVNTQVSFRITPYPLDISRLPETPYVNLVGRDDELHQLDKAWSNGSTSIISAVAEGGAGKSSLINEWLVRLQRQNYGAAEAVLAWSFYSQGSKERATSAEGFLSWTVQQLDLKPASNTTTAKVTVIVEALARRRLLLVLDGVEPLQYGPGPDLGKLKDEGLKELLRRVAVDPPGPHRGLMVLTSRASVADIDRWRKTVAPVIDLDKLSNSAGGSLLRDNGVWGRDEELEAATKAFGGHALALSLLAGFLVQTQNGDVRRRDHVKQIAADYDDPRHAHAKRVMQSYADEWLSVEPALDAIMSVIGLFDRPADINCLAALRDEPIIQGLTESLVSLANEDWNKAVSRLRAARLLLPPDRQEPNTLDSHPLVRDWFGERLKRTKEIAWKEAHGRLYERLRDTTKEGNEPTLEGLAPLYQAIAHGCRAERHLEALKDVYIRRICRQQSANRIEYYASKKLGAIGSNLAAISWFFDKAYDIPVKALPQEYRDFVLSQAAGALRSQGRLAEALPVQRAVLDSHVAVEDWANAANSASSLGQIELLLGEVAAAVASSAKSVEYADRSGNRFQRMARRSNRGNVMHVAGQLAEAERLFAEAERLERNGLLFSVRGYQYCDLLLARDEYANACDRAEKTLVIARENNWLVDIALDTLTLGRAHHGLALASVGIQLPPSTTRDETRIARARLDDAVNGLRSAGTTHHIPRGLLARAGFLGNIGDWGGAARDLDEVEEIAELGPMKLFLCDLALQRARLELAKIEAFAPLNGFIEGAPPKAERPGEAACKRLYDEAAKQLTSAAGYIERCGYHRRDRELIELQAVLRDKRSFESLPPRV